MLTGFGFMSCDLKLVLGVFLKRLQWVEFRCCAGVSKICFSNFMLRLRILVVDRKSLRGQSPTTSSKSLGLCLGLNDCSIGRMEAFQLLRFGSQIQCSGQICCYCSFSSQRFRTSTFGQMCWYIINFVSFQQNMLHQGADLFIFRHDLKSHIKTSRTCPRLGNTVAVP